MSEQHARHVDRDAGTDHVTGHLVIIGDAFKTLMQPLRDLHVGETGKLGQGLVVGDRQDPRHDLGIDADGGLLLEIQGQKRKFMSGEASLRPLAGAA